MPGGWGQGLTALLGPPTVLLCSALVVEGDDALRRSRQVGHDHAARGELTAVTPSGIVQGARGGASSTACITIPSQVAGNLSRGQMLPNYSTSDLDSVFERSRRNGAQIANGERSEGPENIFSGPRRGCNSRTPRRACRKSRTFSLQSSSCRSADRNMSVDAVMIHPRGSGPP
jgi:hypothetical protein